MIHTAFFAILWFVAGYAPALLLNQFFTLPLEPFQFGLLGLLVGLIMLVPIIRTEEGRRLFYQGPDEDEDGDPRIGCLWVTPFLIMLLTIIGWVYSILLIWLVRA